MRHSVQRAPFVLRALFGVRAPFTINVPLTILSSCLPMDYLFQITFDGLFVSDNIYFIQLFKIISFRYIHEYLFCNEIFVSDTVEFQSNCDLLWYTLGKCLCVVCRVCICAGGLIWSSQGAGRSYKGVGHLVSIEQGYIFSYRILEN